MWRGGLFVVFLSLVSCAPVRIVQITDTHIGENCSGVLTYENCKPVRTLLDAVSKVNELDPQPNAVLITGDLTSSALMPEFQKVYEILSGIKAPWFPVLGNHDSWPYTRHADGTFDQTSTPTGDQFFAQVFGERLKDGSKGSGVSVSQWPTSTCLNGNFGFQTWHHNFLLEFDSLPSLYVLGLDWTARGDALPEPGVGPEAELHDYPCGTLPWLDKQLQSLAAQPAAAANTTRFFLAQHHPFHNLEIYSPLGRNLIKNFTFDNVQSAAVQQVFAAASFGPESILGVIAGHMHRWFYGDAWTRFTALDSQWMKVREWETPAAKGWVYGEDFVSAFTVFDFDSLDGAAPSLVNAGYMWKLPNGAWKPHLEGDSSILEILNTKLQR